MLQVSTLGNSLMTAGDLRVAPSSTRSFATLLYLASEPGRRVPRAALQSLIFPDIDDRKGAHCLRQLVYKLRQSGAPIESRSGNVWIAPDKLRVDYIDVTASVQLTLEQLASIEGGFLSDYTPAQNGRFAEWLDDYRTRTTLQIRRVVLRDLAKARLLGDWKTVERAARSCLALDPLNEEATLALAEAIALSGSKAAAVRLLDDYLADVGFGSPDLRLPATLLRRRISERIPERSYGSPPDLPFVGRDDEMAFLAERFHHALRGESQCIVISGEPGIGKTRLATEFSNVAVLDGARVERMNAQPHDIHRPLGAFIELVPRLLQLPGALGCSPDSMAALKRLTTYDANAETERREAHIDAESVFYGITRAISDLIEAITGEAILVLVVEDTHWLDSLSLRVIGDLVSVRRERRLFVVLTSRDPTSVMNGIRHADCVAGLSLKGITIDVATNLIARTVGAAADDRVLTSWMASVSSGNPLYIAAVTAHFLATGERFAVPPTLRALLMKRLDRMDRRTFAVLQICAVLGKYCTIARLAAALEMPKVSLLEAFQEAAALLALGEGDCVTVAHALIRDVILDQSTELAIRLAHRRAAEVLTSVVGAQSPEPAELWELAEHWLAAADYKHAMSAFRACARHAMEIGRPREAALALDRALDLPIRDETRTEVPKELVYVATTSSEYDLARRGIGVWRETVGELNHDSLELSELRTNAVLGDQLDQTVERLLSCVGDAEASPTHRLRGGALLLVIALNELRPSLAEHARALLGDVLVAPNAEQDPDVAEFLMFYHCPFGDLPAAVQSAKRRIGLTADQSPSMRARDLLNASRVFWHAGLPGRAIASLDELNTIAEKAGLVRIRILATTRMASFFLDMDEGSDHRSRFWFDIGERLFRSLPEGPPMLDRESTLIQRSIAVGDIALATKQLNDLGALSHQNLSANRWFSTAGLRLRQLAGDVSLHGVNLEPILVTASSLPRQETCDLEITVVAEAIASRGHVRDAANVVSTYLARTRLTRCPVDFNLMRLGRRLGIPPIARGEFGQHPTF